MFMAVTLPADVDHRTRGLFEAGLADVMASFLAVDDLADIAREFGVGGSADHAAGEVVIHLREEARANLAVGGEANPAAVAAEGT